MSENGLVWFDFGESRPGQRVAFYPLYTKMGQMRAWAVAQAAAVRMAEGGSAAEFAQRLDELCEGLAVLVADWDLEDAEGVALPRPNRASAFYDLTLGEDGEIAALMTLLRKQIAPDPNS